jgi:hypothetical protein
MFTYPHCRNSTLLLHTQKHTGFLHVWYKYGDFLSFSEDLLCLRFFFYSYYSSYMRLILLWLGNFALWFLWQWRGFNNCFTIWSLGTWDFLTWITQKEKSIHCTYIKDHEENFHRQSYRLLIKATVETIFI